MLLLAAEVVPEIFGFPSIFGGDGVPHCCDKVPGQLICESVRGV